MHKEPLLARARRAVADTVLEPLAGKAIDAAMRAGLARLADAVHKTGGQPLDIALPDGSHLSLGGPARALLRLQDPAALALMLHPNLEQLGEAFVQGRIDIEGDMLEAIRAAEALARAAGHPTEQRGMAPRARHASGQDAADIAFHYDVGNDFYRLWLDERWVYSCAYFKSPEATLDQAQRDKLDHICRKLQLTAGDRFLDVGCGWGALVMHAARHYGVQAVGITLSQAQWAHAQSRIASEGLTEQAKVLRLDYRQLPEHFGKHRFDKIASVGMFEHVGLQQLPIYFGAVAEVLRDRGLFLNHGITASDVQSRPVGSGVSKFIEKYVFPHGELPHVSLALQQMSAAGFEVTDIESLRPHYALTLAHWSKRLETARDAAQRATSEKTVRIWRAYLAGCAVGFEQGWINVYQMLGSRQIAPGPTDLPLTRDWIYAQAG